jgi:hypothetical protein
MLVVLIVAVGMELPPTERVTLLELKVTVGTLLVTGETVVVREMLPEKPPIADTVIPGCVDQPWLTTMMPPMGFEMEKSDPAGKTLTATDADLDTVPLVPTTVMV